MQKLLQKTNHTTLYFLSQVSRKEGQGKGHNDCSSHECIANNVDMRHYETRHRTPSCTCKIVDIPKPALIDILRSGGIPLVSVHSGPHNTVEIKIEEAKSSTSYFVISHVWSDGLRNPNSNGLPHCQLEYLSTCLHRLPPRGYQGIYYNEDEGIVPDICGSDAIAGTKTAKPVLFWMDTLCIPVDDEYAHLRTSAINKMAA